MLIKLRKMMTNQKGFTLVELMVVIAILGILAAIAIPKLTSATDSAKLAKVQADLRTIGGAVAMYQAKNGKLPDTLSVLEGSGADKELAAVPKPPAGAGADAYTYDKATGIASYSFDGKTYKSDGTNTATPKT